MNQFRITLNFTLSYHNTDDDWGMDGRRFKAKRQAFERTDKYYEEHSIIDHIKENDAMGMVEYLFYDAEVKSAEWDASSFAIHMVVEADQTEKELLQELWMHSLEDGEYEACCETGWTLMTRGENGEVFGPPWDANDTWEYATVDYRENPINIVKI